MTERINISEVQKLLDYKDRRSVRRWCRNNGLRILCDIGSNKQYVLKDEFEIAQNQCYSTQKQLITQNQNTKTVNEYKPLGKYETNFLTSLLNIEIIYAHK